MSDTNALDALIQSLRRLPGVGVKSASRMAFHLLQHDRDGARALARSLEEAGPKTFVYIDSQGKVRPPTQYRMMQAASYAMLTTILVGGSVLYTYLWGVMGLLFPLVFGSLVAFSAYNYLLRTARPTVAMSYAYVNPALAVALGAVFGGETVGPAALKPPM